MLSVILSLFSCSNELSKSIDLNELDSLSRNLGEGEYLRIEKSSLNYDVIKMLNDEAEKLDGEIIVEDYITIVHNSVLSKDEVFLENLIMPDSELLETPKNDYFDYSLNSDDSRHFLTVSHIHQGSYSISSSHSSSCPGGGSWISIGTSLSSPRLVYNGLYSYTKRVETKTWRCSNSGCSGRLKRTAEYHSPGGS